ncbi:hypothetical protein J22TS1_44760 [Siminovitchia terrae]|uniref:YfcC family protein n=1 Tax=Siminovitchia terrae TaxID=1914933 RepID=UPI001AFE80B1|nr:YfcC family protein [Siminovitchia terrae]GIN93425.1 hypothetical protein J22TS1_44760 [Siminovitchia terrae]
MSALQEREIEVVEDQKKPKGISVNPFVLMFIVVAVVTVLTYIVPAGNYERVEENGRTLVDPDSFQFVESSPVGFFEMFNSFHMGMIEGAPIILLVFMFGGAVGIMQESGTIDSFIKSAAVKFSSKEKLIIPVMVLIFMTMGTLIGSAEDTLIYLGIVIPMTIALGYDAITGYSIVALGAMAGFLSGVVNPYNVGVAQGIAELPLFSGMGLRIALFAVLYVVTVGYIFRHANKVKKNPTLAIYGRYTSEASITLEKDFTMSKRHFASLMVLLLTFAGLVYGVVKLEWYLSEIGGLFLLGGIIMGLISGLSINKVAEGFVSGASGMTSGALIIGFAYSILVVIKSGGIMDTILYYSTSLVGSLPSSLNAIGLFFVQLCLNFLVPSGSGQAALTMPIVTPLGDMMGLTRQTIVLAFQMGDGMSNIIFPTVGVLMAGLAIAGIPYVKWLKWVLPYFLIQVGVGIVFLIIAQMINYGPF